MNWIILVLVGLLTLQPVPVFYQSTSTLAIGIESGVIWEVRGYTHSDVGRSYSFNYTYEFVHLELNTSITDLSGTKYYDDNSTSAVRDTIFDDISIFATYYWDPDIRENIYTVCPLVSSINWSYNLQQWHVVRLAMNGNNDTGYNFREPTNATGLLDITYENGTQYLETEQELFLFYMTGPDLLSHKWYYLKDYGIIYKHEWIFGNRYGNWNMNSLWIPVDEPTTPTNGTNGNGDPHPNYIGIVLGVMGVSLLVGLIIFYRRKQGGKRELDEVIETIRDAKRKKREERRSA